MNQEQFMINAARHEVWAILPDVLQSLLAKSPHPDSLPEGDGVVAVTKPGPKSGRVAQISIIGGIARRASMWSDFFGGASVEGTIAALRNVAADPDVTTVLLNIDSPGGTVDGLPELAAEVRKLRDTKHVVAIANSLAASAAYWIASQADEIVATPEALIGSIGVFTIHQDWSELMSRWGIKSTYIKAGKYKTEANPDEPLSDDAREHLQGIVDGAYDLFIADVAKGRNVTAAHVRSNYGEGRVLTAKDAKAAGMVDRIAGYHETIGRLTGVKADGSEIWDQGLGNPSPADVEVAASDQDDTAQTVGNSLAAKRLRLELLEKF